MGRTHKYAHTQSNIFRNRPINKAAAAAPPSTTIVAQASITATFFAANQKFGMCWPELIIVAIVAAQI